MCDLYLRFATFDDAKILYEWRTDEETQRHSFHTASFSFEHHLAWLCTVLKEPAQRLYIMMLDDKPIGQVRLSFNGDAASISYSIAPLYRMQGYGMRILVLAENELIKTNPAIHFLMAEVKEENVASQRIFEKLHYDALQKNAVIYYQKAIREALINAVPQT